MFIHAGEQNDPAYMRMNPAGQVPVLKDGKKIVTDSDAIIRYVDENVHTGKWRELYKVLSFKTLETPLLSPFGNSYPMIRFYK